MNKAVFQTDLKSLQSVRDMQELAVTFARNELELAGHTLEASAVMVTVVNTSLQLIEYIDEVTEAMVERAAKDIGIDLTFLGEEEPGGLPPK